jgi:diguanylate cyclase (GGDEF)-like protein
MPAIEIRRALDRARAVHYEDHEGALAEAIRAHDAARALGDAGLCCRALTLQAAVMLQRGDLRAAVTLLGQAEPQAEDAGEDIRAELAAVKAQLNFFAGSYPEALVETEKAIALADAGGTADLRLFVRRYACVVFGNLGVSDWPERLNEVLRLAIEACNLWEEAMSRNDLAHLIMEQGDLAAAEREIEAAFAAAAPLAPRNRFALAVISCTRSEIRLRAGHAEDALFDAQCAGDLLTATGDPNPYLLAMIVVIEVQALLALGRLDEAERVGQRTVDRLGERVPQGRSLILGTVATALREAGRIEQAYDVLARSVELERRAFVEMAEMQRAARSESDELAAKNRELEQVVRELDEARATLERRTQQLETLQEQLREQADRDWLTGLHNRRYLAREIGRHAAAPAGGPFSLAVLDLDHFKAINDRFGHRAGDEVLMRVAALLLGELRGQDVVVRTGGEEFVLLMPHTDVRAAASACERVRTTIRGENWGRIVPGMTLTASVGVATAEDAGDLRALTELADQRLYEAKRRGRDRVVA